MCAHDTTYRFHVGTTGGRRCLDCGWTVEQWREPPVPDHNLLTFCAMCLAFVAVGVLVAALVSP